MRSFRSRLVGSLAAVFVLALLSAGIAAAHAVEHAGPYTIEVGWQHEPTYVGEANGVQVIISQGEGKPITDLGADDLKVVVSTGDQQSGELTFEPGFDPEEMTGNLGEYDAAIVPTAPGDYTFHVTGSVHGQSVDITVTSGGDTFNTVVGTSDIEFPTKLPSVSEIVTRLDRLDSRIATAAQAPTGPTQADVDAAAASASDAKSAANTALLVGGGLGAIGIVVALGALAYAGRLRRRATA
jgi:hypothetical protein